MQLLLRVQLVVASPLASLLPSACLNVSGRLSNFNLFCFWPIRAREGRCGGKGAGGKEETGEASEAASERCVCCRRTHTQIHTADSKPSWQLVESHTHTHTPLQWPCWTYAPKEWEFSPVNIYEPECLSLCSRRRSWWTTRGAKENTKLVQKTHVHQKITVSLSIHPFRVAGNWCLSPAVTVQEAAYPLDQYRAHLGASFTAPNICPDM